jgi:type IV secretion system protein VirD4
VPSEMNAGASLYRLPSPESETQARRELASAVVRILVLLGALTQSFASRLGFDPILGRPWISGAPGFPRLFVVSAVLLSFLALFAYFRRVAVAPQALALFAAICFALSKGGGLYYPWMILAWLLRFHQSTVLAHLLPLYQKLALGGSLGIALLHTGLLLTRGQSPRFPDVHGSARFANPADIEKAELLELEPVPGSMAIEGGVFLGTFGSGRSRRPLTVAKDRHTLLLAPSRGGKGVGVVIPTALSWSESLVVHDIKGENLFRTAGFRREDLGHTILIWDPTRPNISAAYNPLAEVRPGENEIRDAQTIADSLIDPQGDKKLTHWDMTAHDLLTGLTLHVLYAEAVKTLTTCASFLSQPGVSIREALTVMRETFHLQDRPHPKIAEIAQALLNKADEELSGVVSTAMTCLRLYRDPLIESVTSRSDFFLRDLVDAPVPVTLYLVVPPGDQERVQPLVRLLLTQMARRLVERMDFAPDRPPRNRLLLLLDEFPTLGHLPAFERNLGYFAGYGISSLLVCQDLTQLRGIYGPREAITPNCDYRVAFTPNMPETAKLLSDLCGETTVHHRHVSRRVGGLFGGQPTSTPTEARRPLLTVGEILNLPRRLELLFANSCPPILADRFHYYEDPEYLRRSLIPPPVESDRLPAINPWDAKPLPPRPTPRLTENMPRLTSRRRP